jgi:hypothetical protein
MSSRNSNSKPKGENKNKTARRATSVCRNCAPMAQVRADNTMANVIYFRTVAPPIDVIALAKSLEETLLPMNPTGGTYDPRTATFFPRCVDDDIYIVSVERHEFRLRGAPSAARLISWLSRVRKLLAVEKYYLGWWLDGTDLVFDISVPCRGPRDTILAIAYSWGQEAVYHPASGEVLNVAPESERAA